MRIGAFDVLRAVLAWWVVATHAIYFSGLDPAMCHADLAVNGFVLISGVVITLLLTEKGESYGAFILRRILRLTPALFVSVALSLALRPWTVGDLPADAGREASENSFWWEHIAAHLSLLYGAIPGWLLPHAGTTFLVPAWSVSLEMQLYLVAPLLAWALKHYSGATLRLWPLTMLVLLPQFNWRLHSYSEMGAFLPQKLYLFAGGALLYWFLPQLSSWSLGNWSKLLGYLGRISYSTYLLHWPIMALLNRWLSPIPNPLGHAALLLLVSVIPIISASWLLYTYVELPGIRFGKWLIPSTPTP